MWYGATPRDAAQHCAQTESSKDSECTFPGLEEGEATTLGLHRDLNRQGSVGKGVKEIFFLTFL